MDFDRITNRILEMYLNLDPKGTLYPKDPVTNKVIKSDSFSIPENAKIIDSINGYDIYQLTDGDWFEFYIKDPQETEASVRMAGSVLGDAVYQEREIDASKTNKFPVISLYHYIILDKNISLITDNEHSIGAKNIWIKLLKDSRIKFHYAVENKLDSPSVDKFSSWTPLSKKQIANPVEFWDEKSRYSLTSSVVLVAQKK